MARPTKLTPAVCTAICDAVREGASFEGACEAAGIAVATGHEWYARLCAYISMPPLVLAGVLADRARRRDDVWGWKDL